MKNILFVNSSLSGGGSEKVMTILANAFSEKKYNVEMVLVRENKEKSYKLCKEVKCHNFNYKYKNKIYKFFSRIIKLRNLIKNNKYDYIVSFMYDINFIVLLSCLGLNKKVIVSERADPNNRKKNKILSNLLEKILYVFAYKVVFQTDYVKSIYPNYIQSKSIVIPNPLDEKIPLPSKEEKEKEFVAVGRFNEQKNFEMLIEAFVEFHSEHTDYFLTIYGDGILREKYESLIKNNNAEKYIFLPGYKENVNELMKKASVYISTSNYEGISNSMLEALAMGMPSICTDCPVGGAKLVIDNGNNGILIPTNNKEELLKAMNLIVSDEKIKEKLIRNSSKIRVRFSVEKIISEWEKIIK